jgi:transposase
MKAGRRDQRKQPSGSQPLRTRRRFTQEFKLEAVRLAAIGDRRVSEVARDLGIGTEMLRQWKRQAAARAGQAGSDVFPGNGKLPSQDEEIRRLRRENAQLREERDILGKATAFFARNPR